MAPFTKPPLMPTVLRRWYWALTIALTLLVWVCLALALRPVKDADNSYASRPSGIVTGVENDALDLLFQLRDVSQPSRRGRGLAEPITIIDIDEASIRRSNVRLQKWPRSWYARLIDRASEGGANVIGLDVYLSEEGGTSAEDKAADQQLAESIANAGNVVVAMKLDAGGTPAITPLAMFADPAYAVGFVDFPLDSDGFVRSAQLFRARRDGTAQFSFAAGLAQGFTEQELRPQSDDKLILGERVIPLRRDLNLQLDFRGRTPAFQRVSAADILFGGAPLPDDLFRDRMVLIGASNNDAPDLFATPFYEYSALARLLDGRLPGAPARTPGVELHATTAATMLYGDAPVRPRYIWQMMGLLLPLALVALAVFWIRAWGALVAVALIAVLALALASWAFNSYGLILPLASTWFGIGLLTLLGLGAHYAREQALLEEKEAESVQVMDIFSRCVSREVAEELWRRRGQVSLSGERRIVTVIFTDIRGFTSKSEKVSSEEVVEWLNDYFGRMHRVVTSFGGHINKFLGDGLMIVFGAPVDRTDVWEARAAVDCGLAMLAEVERINEEWKAKERPDIAIGVGINTGEAHCGVIGAEQRLEYTLIGDTVNLASRLESATKDFGVPLIISDATARFLGDDYEMRPLGEAKVKGKSINTLVYTVTGKKAGRETAATTSAAATTAVSKP